MSYQRMRYGSGVDPKEYAKAETEFLIYRNKAIECSWVLMESFTKIEQGFAKVIVNSLGLFCFESNKGYVHKLGKAFPVSTQINMVNDLVKSENLKISGDDKIQWPSELGKTSSPFIEACRTAIEYRNELAHNGVMMYIKKAEDGYDHSIMLGLDNPRNADTSDPFVAVNIEGPTTQPVGYIHDYASGYDLPQVCFTQWIIDLSSRLPPEIGRPPLFKKTDKPINAQEFFMKFRDKELRSQEKANQGKLKKLDSFISSLEV